MNEDDELSLLGACCGMLLALLLALGTWLIASSGLIS